MDEHEELIELRAYKQRAEIALKIKDAALLNARRVLVKNRAFIDKLWAMIEPNPLGDFSQLDEED